MSLKKAEEKQNRSAQTEAEEPCGNASADEKANYAESTNSAEAASEDGADGKTQTAGTAQTAETADSAEAAQADDKAQTAEYASKAEGRKKFDPSKFFSRSWVVCVGAILCCVLWGSAFPCVKIGYRLFNVDTSHVPSVILFAGLRFTLAGAMVIAFGCASQKRFIVPKKNNWWRVLLLCCFQAVAQYVFFYIGLTHVSGVKGSVLNGLGVFFTIIFACFLFRTERFNAVKLLGCILGFAGVVVVNLGGEFTFTFSLLGEGFIILSGVSAAVAAGLVKIFSRYENTTTLCGWQFLIGGCVLIVVGAAFGGRVAPSGFGAIAELFYLAFISSFAFTLQGYLVKYNPVSRVAVFKSANPLFGALFSAMLLGESGQLLSYYTLVAIALVCLGIFVINKFGERNKKST